MLINKSESTGLKNLNDSNTFIKCSKYIDTIYKTIEEYNLNRKRKILIVFNDMIAHMLKKIKNQSSDKKINPVVTELFIRGRK